MLLIRRLPRFAIFLLPFVISLPAFAQLDEITVTAQKREQSLQDVPISISALTGAQFEMFNVGRQHRNLYSRRGH
jgi:iron complex outermembrane receptor protein